VQTPVVLGYACLVAAAFSYGASTLLLSHGLGTGSGGTGSGGTGSGGTGSGGNESSPGALRLPSYRWGLALQGLAFLLAFVARIDLPLLLVQAGVSASVAVSAVVGAALGRWRLDPLDGTAVASVVAGVALAGAASEPSRASTETMGAPLTGLAVTVGCLAVWQLSARRPGVLPLGATTLGALAGLAFGSSAVGARMLAADPFAALRHPAAAAAALLLVTGLGAGQVLLTTAFRRGSVTGPVAAMYVAATVWPSLAGLVWLADAVQPGRWYWAAAGLVLALAGTARLAGHESHPSSAER
jgi:drug/metabolite transporter (DMT)-like permease